MSLNLFRKKEKFQFFFKKQNIPILKHPISTLDC